MKEIDIVLFHISLNGVGDRTGVIENVTARSVFEDFKPASLFGRRRSTENMLLLVYNLQGFFFSSGGW